MGKKFDRLKHHIAHEYERKGFSSKEAERIGKATAAKIYREKKNH